ncbi:glyceraldehyde-3-phosphate dehydrogenase [Platysternon megacephalum]|uniref:Glyceraldehyde-3-phosphate dehydrogenase n=1 Tax=Platysternon megacephalum TaxID=55544 RepID=A0A4D9DCH6_9SAUR|nr:glyceraldehyde-3-phosphate dehydrogenase [Platysternon megacephalum]
MSCSKLPELLKLKCNGPNFGSLLENSQRNQMPKSLVPNCASPPCNVTSVAGACGPPGSPCGERHWTARLRIWDGAGIRSVLAGGAAVPHWADGAAATATYSSDCCTREAELLVTNRLGEEYRCLVAAPPAGAAGDLALTPWWGVAALAVQVAFYVGLGH